MISRKIQFSPPDITDEEIHEVVEALKSGWITTGPRTKKFEENIAQYIGVKKSVCLNSATAAMELALRFLGIGPGDEVITSAYTYSASAAVIEHVGAKIVLVDIADNQHSFEMDYYALKKAINHKTKAIIPVDIGGILCDYEKINSIVREAIPLYHANNSRQSAIGRICVLADAAHSFGAKRGRIQSGMFADITCFSFHAVKNLTTAEGGALVWTHNFGLTDEEIYREFMLLSLHGQSKDALSKTKIGSWEYDIIYLGYKNNMTDIMSALGLAQLKRYDDLLNKRHELISIYVENLNHKLFRIAKHKECGNVSSGHLMLVNVNGINEIKRNRLVQLMADSGIPCNVHYKPLPMFSAYKNIGFDIKDYPNSYERYSNQITLPLHTLLTKEDVIYICERMNSITQSLIDTDDD